MLFNMPYHLIFLSVGSCLSAFLLTRLLIPVLKKKGVLDIPTSRSSHHIITPRGGGLSIVLVFLAGSIYLIFEKIFYYDFPFLLGYMLLIIVSFSDDKKSLSPLFRFGAQIIASCLVVFANDGMAQLPLPESINVLIPPGFSHLLGVFWCLAIINIYNFMDGIDGYASVQALIFCLGAGWLFNINGATPTMLLLGAAVLGFLPYNWNPAKVFLGDVGSISIGFIFACFPFYLPETSLQQGFFSSVILLWFFIADGSWAIIKRSIKKEKIWLPHRTHLYQKLIIIGWSHWKVVMLILFCQVTLLPLLIYGKDWITIFVASSFFILLLAFTFFLDKDKNKTH